MAKLPEYHRRVKRVSSDRFFRCVPLPLQNEQAVNLAAKIGENPVAHIRVGICGKSGQGGIRAILVIGMVEECEYSREPIIATRSGLDTLIDFIMDNNEFNIAFTISFGYDQYDSGA